MAVRLVTDESERISKEMDFVPNEVIFRLFPEGLRKRWKTSVKIWGFLAKIRIVQLPNWNPECYRYGGLFVCLAVGERIILKWILRKYILGVKTRFNGVRIGSIGLPIRNFGLYKFRVNLFTNSVAIKFSTMDLFSYVSIRRDAHYAPGSWHSSWFNCPNNIRYGWVKIWDALSSYLVLHGYQM